MMLDVGWMFQAFSGIELMITCKGFQSAKCL